MAKLKFTDLINFFNDLKMSLRSPLTTELISRTTCEWPKLKFTDLINFFTDLKMTLRSPLAMELILNSTNHGSPWAIWIWRGVFLKRVYALGLGLRPRPSVMTQIIIAPNFHVKWKEVLFWRQNVVKIKKTGFLTNAMSASESNTRAFLLIVVG